MVLAGLLAEQVAPALAAFGGYRRRRTDSEGEWSCVVLEAPEPMTGGTTRSPRRRRRWRRRRSRAGEGGVDAPLRVHAAFAGCKVSQADSEAVLESLARRGCRSVGDPAQADVHVVLTCGVTGEAERSSRQLARRLAAHGRPVVVAGCAAALRPEQFAGAGLAPVGFRGRRGGRRRGRGAARAGGRRRTAGGAPAATALPARRSIAAGVGPRRRRFAGGARQAAPGSR